MLPKALGRRVKTDSIEASVLLFALSTEKYSCYDKADGLASWEAVIVGLTGVVASLLCVQRTVYTRYKWRGHPELNWGPVDLQSNALPLSYTPIHAGSTECWISPTDPPDGLSQRAILEVVLPKQFGKGHKILGRWMDEAFCLLHLSRTNQSVNKCCQQSLFVNQTLTEVSLEKGENIFSTEGSVQCCSCSFYSPVRT